MSANERADALCEARSQGDRISDDGPAFEVRSEAGAIIVDITSRQGSSGDEASTVHFDLNPDDAERLIVDLQTRLAELGVSPHREFRDDVGTAKDEPAPERSESDGIPYQELGLTREEFVALADGMVHLAPYWDRDDMDEYGELYTR